MILGRDAMSAAKCIFHVKKQKHRLYQGRVSAVKVNVRNNVHAHTHTKAKDNEEEI
jgi:hypothetical protein